MRSYRAEFAEFLDQLRVGPVHHEIWQRYIVTHYHDDRLEEIRRQCVRLAISQDDFSVNESARNELTRMIAELRLEL